MSPPATARVPKLSLARTWAVLGTLGRHLWPKGETGLRCRVVVALVLLVLAKVVNVYVPILYKHAVDALGGTAAQAVAVPVALIVAYGVARVLAQAVGEIRDAIFSPVSQRAIRNLALEVFGHLHALSLRFHLERQTGGLSRVIERGTTGIEFLIRFTTFNILPTLLEITLVGAILWSLYDWRFSAVTLFAIAGYVLFSVTLSEWRIKFVRRMNEADTEANAKAIDSLLNYETVKYFGNEAHEARRFDVGRRRYETAAIRSSRTLSLLNVGQGALISAGLVAVMVMAGYGVADGTMTLGDFVAVNAFLIQLYQPLNMLGFAYREIRNALVNMEQMFGLLEVPAEIADKPGAPALAVSGGEIVFDHVDFHYEKARPILHDVSFRVASRRSRASCSASTTSPRAACASTARTSATSARRACAPRSAWCRRTPCCSTTRSTTTSPMAGPAPAARRSSRRPAWRASTTSSRRCPTATRRPWASAALNCRAARSSGWRSPARS